MTESRQLPNNFRDRLFEILSTIPALSNSDDRNQLLKGLPRGPVGAIRRSPASNTDLNNILEAAEGWGRVTSGEFALVVIAQNALPLAEETDPGRELADLLAEVGRPIPPTSHSDREESQRANVETRHARPEPEEREVVPPGRNVITVIGIDGYDHWRKLNNAVNDAQGIRNLFVQTFGFIEPVLPLYDGQATKGAITALVEDQLRDKLKPDDALILFFAGHGHTRVDKLHYEEIETGYIVPVEAQRKQWSDYINMTDWLRAISTLPARHIMVILDSCHSGFALGEAMEIHRGDPPRYERDLVSRRSRKVFTSARRDQLALDGGSIANHSLFTGTLIAVLNSGEADIDGDGIITGTELGLSVQQRVGQHSRSKQTPDFGSFRFDKRGEMVIKVPKKK